MDNLEKRMGEDGYMDSIKMAAGLERVVDAKMFVLLLTAALYGDITCMVANVDPKTLQLHNAFVLLRNTSLFQLTVGIGTYIFLMVALFPGLRLFLGLLRIWLCEIRKRKAPDVRAKGGASERKFSDWSAGAILLFVWDAKMGWQAGSHAAYRGFAMWLFHSPVLRSNALLDCFLRLALFGFVLVMVAAAWVIEG